MKLRQQSGITLVETAVVAGIIAVAVGGALYAIAAFGKHVAQQGGAARIAALSVARQTLHVAQNAWKYGSPGSAPSGAQSIMLPVSSAQSAPATVTTTLSASAATARITVTVRYTPEPGRSDPGVVRISGEAAVKAPLPGSLVDRPGLIPLPSGAP